MLKRWLCLAVATLLIQQAQAAFAPILAQSVQPPAKL